MSCLQNCPTGHHHIHGSGQPVRVTGPSKFPAKPATGKCNRPLQKLSGRVRRQVPRVEGRHRGYGGTRENRPRGPPVDGLCAHHTPCPDPQAHRAPWLLRGEAQDILSACLPRVTSKAAFSFQRGYPPNKVIEEKNPKISHPPPQVEHPP